MGNEEMIILQTKPHWFAYIGVVIRAILLSMIGAMLGDGELFLLLTAIGVILMVPRILRCMTTELVVSSKRVHGKYGIINIKQMDSPINKVQNIVVEKKLLGSIIGFGDICITTSSGSYRFAKIGDPETIKNTIIQAQDDYEEGRFARQSERYEQAMERQTMAQAAMFGGLAQSMQQVAIAGAAQAAAFNAQLPMNAAAAPPASEQSTGEAANNVPQGVMANKKVIKEFPYMLWVEGCPILITKAMISDTDQDDAIELNLEMQNLSDKVVEAVFMDIRGLNVLKEEKCNIPKAAFLDLHIEPGCKAIVKPLKLPDNSIRQIRVIARNVVYTDDSVWKYDGSEELRGIEIKQTHIPEQYSVDMDQICAEVKKGYNNAALYTQYPIFEDSYWVCACGQFNIGDTCVRCKEEKQTIRTYICDQTLEQHYKERLEREEKQREEREAREAEERRLEQERLEKERELEEQERLRKEEERRQKIEQLQNSAKELVVMAGRKSKEAGGKLKQVVSQGIEHPTQQSKMIFCTQCGNPLEEGAKFCPHCGCRIEGEV